MGTHKARRIRRRFTSDDRERLLAAFDRSGLSQCRFSLEHGLSQGLLSRWLATRRLDPAESPSSPGILPVRVIDALDDPRRPRSESILVRLDDRVIVELPPDFDRSAFSDVLFLLGIERC